MRKAS